MKPLPNYISTISTHGILRKGLDTRNAMAKALEEMSFGKYTRAINRWRLSEREELHKICLTHGIENSETKKSRGYSYTTQEYGKYKHKIRELEKAAKKKLENPECRS